MDQNKIHEKMFSFAIINNIPAEYHSKDLRNYFSQFIESKGFEIFHFRHRPELQISTTDSTSESQNESKTQETKKCTCCVIKLPSNRVKHFFTMYNRKHWLDNSGNVMSRLCFITRIKLPEDSGEKQLLTRGEQKVIPTDRETFTVTDLNSLPELHPPDVMPNGNVGTPTMVFMDFIKQCRLPPSIIKKLGLSFPKVRTNKMYGNVQFDYGRTVESGNNQEEDDIQVYSANGHELIAEGEVIGKQSDDKDSTLSESNGKRKKRRKKMDKEQKKRMDLRIEEKMIEEEDVSEGDNDSCEEWERHEALYDDPSNQERNKERLFEEEIELKWEKGGSGLVFYTDAQYWQEQEGDFDEQTADDWDVDMSGYYEEGAGDKDARDYLAIREEKRRRDCIEGTDRFAAANKDAKEYLALRQERHRRNDIEGTDRFTAGIAKKKTKPRANNNKKDEEKIGKFEAHTKGIGRKILESQGWTEGQGLGSTIKGRKDALDNEGQTPKDRRGFGYHGEKLNRHLPKAQRKVIISTVFDDPKKTDPHEPLNRRHEPYNLKYRDEVVFEKSDETLNL